MIRKLPFAVVTRAVTRAAAKPALTAVPTLNQFQSVRYFSEPAAGKGPEGAEKSEAVEAKVEVEDPVEVLRQQNKTLQDEVKTLKDKLLRSYAEEENVRRIAQRDVAAAKEYANTKFAKSLLDVADNLERAIDVIDHEQRAEADPQFLNLLQGVEMTQKGLVKVFESHGISRVSTLAFILVDIEI